MQVAIHDLERGMERPLRWLVGVLVAGGMASIVAEYGFFLSRPVAALVHVVEGGVIWGFLSIFLVRLLLMRHRWAFLVGHKVQSILMTLLVLDLLAFQTPQGRHWLAVYFHLVDVEQITVIYVAFIQGFILVFSVLEGAYSSRALSTWRIRPAQTLVLSFVILITLGSLLLLLPRATIQPGSLSILNAVFTATSAVCVTGLIVVDTATYFTPLGQGIILGLCQLGGLGIITFATVFGMMMRGGMGMREKALLQDFVSSKQFGEISTTVRRIVWSTLFIEALGAVSLYHALGEALPAPATRAWFAVFHAVSAFCNAGFSTFSGSLSGPGTAMHPGVNLTVIVLIVLGGLGFSVLWEGLHWVLGALRGTMRRLSVQSRLVLISTAVLIVSGAFLFALLEAHGVLGGRPEGEQVMGALFQSITARTAGFNTLAISRLALPATLLLMVLMFIGASPGSTGGGLKTTTVAVLFLTTVATIRGKARVEFSRRTLPWKVINQAYVVFFFAVGVVLVSLLVLSITEGQPFLDLAFEEISAFATVGLSRGITPFLSTAGKMVIIMSMFVGRVGGLTLGVALARQVSTTAYEYPTEAVMVG
ncbi:MAG: TrkH family potassium uptake protein [Acidobacteriota bacterium]